MTLRRHYCSSPRFAFATLPSAIIFVFSILIADLPLIRRHFDITPLRFRLILPPMPIYASARAAATLPFRYVFRLLPPSCDAASR